MSKFSNWVEDLFYPGRRELRELIFQTIDHINKELDGGKTLDEVLPYESEVPPEWDRAYQAWVLRSEESRAMPIGKTVIFKRGRGEAKNEQAKITEVFTTDSGTEHLYTLTFD